MGKLGHHRVCSTDCRIQYRWWHMRRRLRSAKQTQTRRLNTHYFRVRKSTTRGVASCPDPPSTTIYSSSDSNTVHKECNHLSHEGLRHKELYYNVFEKNHAVGALGYGSVTMPDGSNPYVEELQFMDNSDIERVPDEDLTPTNCGRHAGNQRPADDAGPTRSRGNVGKRKQRDVMDEMAYMAMQAILTYLRKRKQSDEMDEIVYMAMLVIVTYLRKRKQSDAMDEMAYMAMQAIVTYLRSQSQSSVNNDQSSRTDHMLMCMNCMIEMGIPRYQRTIMWHYFSAHPQAQSAFHKLCGEDIKRCIIDSVVQSQSPPAP